MNNIPDNIPQNTHNKNKPITPSPYHPPQTTNLTIHTNTQIYSHNYNTFTRTIMNITSSSTLTKPIKMENNKEIVNLLVIPYLEPKESLNYQFNQVKFEVSQDLFKFVINRDINQIVYTLNYGNIPVKVWNGCGLEIGTPVMRRALLNKDMILIVQPTPISIKHSLKTSLKNQSRHTLPTLPTIASSTQPQTTTNLTNKIEDHRISYRSLDQQKTSQMIRKINNKCVISYVYVDKNDVDEDWMRVLTHFTTGNEESGIDNRRDSVRKSWRENMRKSGRVQRMYYNVEPIVGKDYTEYHIDISTNCSESNIEIVQNQDTKLLKELLESVSFYYEHSSSSSSKISKLSQLRQKNGKSYSSVARKKTSNTKSYSTIEIDDIFTWCVGKRKVHSSIRLKQIRTYQPILLL